MLKMHWKIFYHLLFLGSTFAIKINSGETQNLDADLKTCLSTVIQKICPGCTTGHFVIPREPAWEAQGFARHLSDSLPMYSVTIYTADHPGYEVPLVNQVSLYLVNTEVDVKRALERLKETSSKTMGVVWVNFYIGDNLGRYLESTIPTILKGGKALNVIFIFRIEGYVQVFRLSIPACGASSTRSLRKLNVCGTKALIQGNQSLPNVTEPQMPILTVIVYPPMFPFIERKTDNPGGFIGQLMNVLKSRLHFTPKYVWNIEFEDMQNYAEKEDLRIVLNLVAAPKGKPSLISSAIMMTEGVWMIATPNSVDERNFLALPFRNGISLYIAILAIYTSATVYVSRDLDKSRVALRLFGMFFGIGVDWFPRKGLYRFLVVLWCFTSYVLVQVYLAALASELSSPTIKTPLRDAEALIKTGIDLFCSDQLKEFYCNFESDSSVFICQKCRSLYSGLLKPILGDEPGMNKSWRPFAIALDTRVLKSTIASPFVTFMEERIGMWPAAIYSKPNMKLLAPILNLSNRLFEAGISQLWLTRYKIKKSTNYDFTHKMLTISRLDDLFVILYVGWSCSIVVFFLEILTKWYRNM